MIYILAFLLVLAIFAAMAVGLVLGWKPIRASCGGLNCKQSENSEECPRHPKQTAL